jgi:Nucleolar protein,Nop52
MEGSFLLYAFGSVTRQFYELTWQPYSGYWMSDKPLVQQALSSELAELVLTISTMPASLSFLGAFWEATVREWNGIDRLRL